MQVLHPVTSMYLITYNWSSREEQERDYAQVATSEGSLRKKASQSSLLSLVVSLSTPTVCTDICPPGCYFWAHEREAGDLESPAWIYQGQITHDQYDCSLS